MAAVVQVLNSIAALSFVYAMRKGKAMVVTPMTALSPVITIMLSLFLYSRTPAWYQDVGILGAAAAMYLMAE